MSMTKDIGIDLGTASVLVYVKGKGIVLNEPSVVAMDKTTGKLLKVGAEAQAMLGRTPGNIIAIRPLREGVISDYDMTERMLREFIHKVAGVSFFKPRVIICVPSGITEVEERAVIDAGIQAGARKVYLIEEPVAAAIGAGIDITQPDGHMVVDIGGGTADIAVISLSGVVESASIKIAGDQLNEAVVKYMRRKHNLLVGERTAEEMKKQIGCVFPKDEEETMDVKGRCLLTGLPKVVTVSSTEMMDAFEEPVERIMEAIHSVLERTPPELVADIWKNTPYMSLLLLSGLLTISADYYEAAQLDGAGKWQQFKCITLPLIKSHVGDRAVPNHFRHAGVRPDRGHDGGRPGGADGNRVHVCGEHVFYLRKYGLRGHAVGADAPVVRGDQPVFRGQPEDEGECLNGSEIDGKKTGLVSAVCGGVPVCDGIAHAVYDFGLLYAGVGFESYSSADSALGWDH